MGIINCYCQLVDPEAVRAELRHLKSLNVDGVVVDCWWGIVEAWTPQKYEWSGYRDLFGISKEFKLKVQVRILSRLVAFFRMLLLTHLIFSYLFSNFVHMYCW